MGWVVLGKMLSTIPRISPSSFSTPPPHLIQLQPFQAHTWHLSLRCPGLPSSGAPEGRSRCSSSSPYGKFWLMLNLAIH